MCVFRRLCDTGIYLSPTLIFNCFVRELQKFNSFNCMKVQRVVFLVILYFSLVGWFFICLILQLSASLLLSFSLLLPERKLQFIEKVRGAGGNLEHVLLPVLFMATKAMPRNLEWRSTILHSSCHLEHVTRIECF